MPKKMSDPQQLGDAGEGAFVAWATAMGWPTPTKHTRDIGTDYICQIPGDRISKATVLMPGRRLEVSVRSTTQNSRAVKVSRSDAKLFFTSSVHRVLALIRRAPVGQLSKVAIRFPDESFIGELEEFLDSGDETHEVRFSDATTDTVEIRQRVEDLLNQPFLFMVNRMRIERCLVGVVEDPCVEIVSTESGSTAWVHSASAQLQIEPSLKEEARKALKPLEDISMNIVWARSSVIPVGEPGVGGSLELLSHEGTYCPAPAKPGTDTGQTPDVPTATHQIRTEVALWNHDRALALAEGVEASLNDGEELSGSSLPQLLALLARVHIIRAGRRDSAAKGHIKYAKSLLSRIDSIPVTAATDKLLAEVHALRGAIENLEKGPDAAVILLGGHTDPHAIRLRLALLINKRDLDGAIALIEDLPKQLNWCDLAVTAYALKDRRNEAEKMVEWAREQHDHNKHRQCVVRLADALFVRSLAGRDEGKIIRPHDLSEEERDGVREVLAALGPVLDPLVATGHVSSGLDLAAIKPAWQANHLLGRREDVTCLAQLMYTHRPVPLEVARSVVTGYIEPPSDLPKRLREEHPGDLDAGILAAVVQSTHMGQHGEAFLQAKTLVLLTDTDEKRADLFQLLQQIWQELEGDALVECERIATALICDCPKLRAMFEAAKALRTGDPDAAIQALESERAEKDSYWLQLRANALMQKAQPDKAVGYLVTAAKRTGDPVLFRRSADLAFHVKKLDIARECYEQLLRVQPDNLVAHGNLASIYAFHLHDLKRTAIHLQALHDAEPENPVHSVNLAICLSQLYRSRESLVLYEAACAQDKPDIRAILGRAELHLSLADPDTALSSLQEFRETAWSEPGFLMSFMSAAYAAGDEEAAQEALEALHELHKTGEVDSNVFRVIPASEGLTMLKQEMKQVQERTEYLHTEMLKGRVPWIWAETISGNAVYWGWRTRTQAMPWIRDDPANRARFSIYATNAFHVRSSARNVLRLMPLECPPQGTRVVVDISSLITLHRLGLLDVAAGYFGEILIPERYLPTVLEDSRKMVLHQRKRQLNEERLRNGIEAGTIAVLQEQSLYDTSMAIADEYGESNEHRYHLVDLVEAVHDAGAINDADYKRMLEVCTKESAVDDAHPKLMQLQDVLVDLSTLETLTSIGMLDAVTRFYRVGITSEDHVQIRHRLEAMRDQQETLAWHFDLWNRIRDDDRFSFVQSSAPEGISAKSVDVKDQLSLLGCFAAQELGIPLLADDRVCQALALNNQPDVEHPACGTDALISALASSGQMDAVEAAICTRQLMQWRYRFVLPSAAVLKAMAAQYRTSLPGQALHEVAEYVHDCMRDAGLFGGAEKTDLKDSMATRLYLSWVTTITDFLVEVWNDQSFTNESAKRLTKWSIQEFLPSPPRVLHGKDKPRFSAMIARRLISQVLIMSTAIPQGKRATDAVKAMKEALTLSNDEYLRIVTEILNDTQ